MRQLLVLTEMTAARGGIVTFSLSTSLMSEFKKFKAEDDLALERRDSRSGARAGSKCSVQNLVS